MDSHKSCLKTNEVFHIIKKQTTVFKHLPSFVLLRAVCNDPNFNKSCCVYIQQGMFNLVPSPYNILNKICSSFHVDCLRTVSLSASKNI